MLQNLALVDLNQQPFLSNLATTFGDINVGASGSNLVIGPTTKPQNFGDVNVSQNGQNIVVGPNTDPVALHNQLTKKVKKAEKDHKKA